MEQGEMIASFNTAPPPGIWIIWIWIGWAMLASTFLIVVHWLLGDSLALRWGIVRNAVRRAENAENEIIQLESKVSAQEIRIEYLEGENETLRELARRKGFRMAEQENEDNDSDFAQWRARQRWKEHAQQTDEFDFDYDITTK